MRRARLRLRGGLAGLCLFALLSVTQAADIDELVGAAVRDNPGQLRRLLEKGVDPNALDSQGRLALVTALQEESPKSIELLLDDGRIDVRRRNRAGETALMIAALKGNLDMVLRLLDLGAEPDHAGWTPLHYAASNGDPRIVELLLARGVRVDAESPNGTTPLMMAAGYGSESAVRLLLKAGAVPERRNARGMDAADFARMASRNALAEGFEDLKRRRAARRQP
ncbi:ankyrin repeat domain-containing protein [Caldimonas tepidiphila]|uniref:ankyrin repeat domain-containing protein n=1 Tax=Caldimonas tepidiphila TaxID=2315841 RepID=UPI000E5B0532|nr:ankyrin repeat domain-containing protein [Caldimonas tepidiphila]